MSLNGYGGNDNAGLSEWRKALYGFEHPQDSARTKVWWFHGETETTRAGITADLEAYRKQGVGGWFITTKCMGNVKVRSMPFLLNGGEC